MKKKLISIINSKAKSIDDEKEVSKILDQAYNWENRTEDSVPHDLFQHFQFFYNVVKNYLNGKVKTPWRVVAICAAVLLYIVNPIDLIADYIPAVGYLDDLAVVIIFYPVVKKYMKGD